VKYWEVKKLGFNPKTIVRLKYIKFIRNKNCVPKNRNLLVD
jgi:hypothetical protein